MYPNCACLHTDRKQAAILDLLMQVIFQQRTGSIVTLSRSHPFLWGVGALSRPDSIGRCSAGSHLRIAVGYRNITRHITEHGNAFPVTLPSPVCVTRLYCLSLCQSERFPWYPRSKYNTCCTFSPFRITRLSPPCMGGSTTILLFGPNGVFDNLPVWLCNVPGLQSRPHDCT